MEKKQIANVTDFQKNKENPFLQLAFDKIKDNTVKKYKKTSGTSQSAILQAVNAEGEVVGHTSFIQQIEVDEEQFTKIYISQFSAFFELKNQGIKVFGYIMKQLIPKQDFFYFFMDDCLAYTGYNSEKSVYIGLASLLQNEIIARGRNDTLYFINPMVLFNGDRITFAKTYVKKQNAKNLTNPNQTNLLNQFEE